MRKLIVLVFIVFVLACVAVDPGPPNAVLISCGSKFSVALTESGNEAGVYGFYDGSPKLWAYSDLIAWEESEYPFDRMNLGQHGVVKGIHFDAPKITDRTKQEQRTITISGTPYTYAYTVRFTMRGAGRMDGDKCSVLISLTLMTIDC